MPAKNLLPERYCPDISPRTALLIWEVYARIGLRPEQAVHLWRRLGRRVPPSQAKDQMHHARRRNLLRLVFPARMS